MRELFADPTVQLVAGLLLVTALLNLLVRRLLLRALAETIPAAGGAEETESPAAHRRDIHNHRPRRHGALFRSRGRI